MDALDGLWLKPCGAIHTIGMAIRIDVVFLDAHLRVLRLCPSVPMRRIRIGPVKTASTLELADGRIEATGLRLADELIAEREISGELIR